MIAQLIRLVNRDRRNFNNFWGNCFLKVRIVSKIKVAFVNKKSDSRMNTFLSNFL